MKKSAEKRFSLIYFLSFLLDAPLFAMYSMLLFILTKELHATALQITIYVSIKPLTALFSSYWNEAVRSRPIEKNLCSLVLIACLPALLFPFVSSVWFAMFGFAVYFFADRAAISGWMELLKTRLPLGKRSWAVSKCSLLLFLAGAFVPVLLAPWLDIGLIDWRWLFFGLAALSTLRLAILFPLTKALGAKIPAARSRPSVVAPWQRAFSVLRKRPDFAYFQLIFMLGGTGIIVMHAVMPKFVSYILNLSYTDFALAFAFAKGMGYAVSAKLWASIAGRMNMYLLCSLVAGFAALCLFLLPLSLFFLPMLHIALFLYGVMQGGSQLGWQLSGPLFSGKEESTPYTGVNVMCVGLRGCFAPTLGSLLGGVIGFVWTLLVGGMLCAVGVFIGLIGHKIWGQAMTPSATQKAGT